MSRIGVFVCHCGLNIAKTVRVPEVVEFAKTLPDVVVAQEYKFMCSTPGQEIIQGDIKKHRLDRVIVAACSPLMHEKTFRKVIENAGLNQYLLTIVNIREHVSWVTEDEEVGTRKAKALINGAVYRARLLNPLTSRFIDVNPNVLVVGGGIAGIQAALEVADAGKKVYLVERTPSVGGHMIQFDKTFPTLDCSACILTPKMDAVNQHPNIDLMTYCEVTEVKGFVGNFTVTVKQKARYIDHEKCNGCLACTEKCPGKGVSEFDEGLVRRKAVYIPFPQAVPQKPVIDRGVCVFFKTGKCRLCEKVCEQGAVDFEQEDRFEEIQVGAIIVATGYDLMDVKPLVQYGYGKYPGVFHSLEVERLFNSAGPTGGKVVLRDMKTAPRSVAILHCIGSRDKNHFEYCSRVCCMYSLKFAHLFKEKTEANIYQLYIDMRAPGKAYEEFYARLLEEDVKFVRGKAARVTENKENPEEAGKLIVEVDDTLAGQFMRIPVDMVVLSPAMKPRHDAKDVARLLNLSTDKYGFLMERHPKLAPLSTMTDGVFIAGACQFPKDIPDTVSQALGAAAEALTIVTKAKMELEAATAVVNPAACSGCMNCVNVCPYGAPQMNAEKGISEINEALCKGCGLCAASCPTSAIIARHFANDQIMAEMEGLMEMEM
ncbi:MAG TPA: CoB--CoM heterodisulfide reductase iron-sulfur subunit A family protein [Syntrophales bacterium]|nr:CoB--CoM heterodisulfide reductase iron-sulfur subunit A family protein [Syntrophales bacterium]HOX94851.1 CoB--CoM heterodisulfide reductase iron-sulfur subunit A family protein [Syntrophales bacterium]HPI58359.1 CoB--CoM heterodisulfide reductase iron-sulfur subunit A family protein [Syntrophales bacterium]HPN26186.1 CoB--CoM heterodisulfide reductase iron-sulfur subunit A family protein [Syntrophales bacterium]HQM30579.1 CoB--CoM heterodisulfide reductase iron-sulfur subunit A family prot